MKERFNFREFLFDLHDLTPMFISTWSISPLSDLMFYDDLIREHKNGESRRSHQRKADYEIQNKKEIGSYLYASFGNPLHAMKMVRNQRKEVRINLKSCFSRKCTAYQLMWILTRRISNPMKSSEEYFLVWISNGAERINEYCRSCRIHINTSSSGDDSIANSSASPIMASPVIGIADPHSVPMPIWELEIDCPKHDAVLCWPIDLPKQYLAIPVCGVGFASVWSSDAHTQIWCWRETLSCCVRFP